MVRHVLATYVAAVVGYDVWFYAVHRALHHPRFYKKYHAQYHRHVQPTWRDAFDSSFVENALSGLGIFVPLLLPEWSSVGLATAWAYCFVRGLMRHDKRFTWLVGSHHLHHHLNPSVNFSSRYVDKVLGTAAF